MFLALANSEAGCGADTVAFVADIGVDNGGAIVRALYEAFIAGDAGAEATAALSMLDDLSLEMAGGSLTKLLITMQSAAAKYKTATGTSLGDYIQRHYLLKAIDTPALEQVQKEFRRKDTSLAQMKAELYNLQSTDLGNLLAFTPAPFANSGTAPDLATARRMVYDDSGLCAYCGHIGHAAATCRKALEVSWHQDTPRTFEFGPREHQDWRARLRTLYLPPYSLSPS